MVETEQSGDKQLGGKCVPVWMNQVRINTAHEQRGHQTGTKCPQGGDEVKLIDRSCRDDATPAGGKQDLKAWSLFYVCPRLCSATVLNAEVKQILDKRRETIKTLSHTEEREVISDQTLAPGMLLVILFPWQNPQLVDF